MPALVVLGSTLAGTRRRLVAAAQQAARDPNVDVVILTGWSPNGGPSEAQQMRDVWRDSSDVEIVLEETASTTAENAARTLPLLLERGIDQAVVICTPLHALRAGWIFRRIYGERRIAVRFRLARELPTPGAVLWELAAFTVSRRQVRKVR